MPSTAATASGTAAGSADRRQFENPDTVGEFIGQSRRDFQRQPGLADSADPGQRHQPMRPHRGRDLGDLGLAPNQARGRRTQVSRPRIQCPQRRKLQAVRDRS